MFTYDEAQAYLNDSFELGDIKSLEALGVVLATSVGKDFYALDTDDDVCDE